MKATLILCLLAGGCACPQMTLVNNTPYALDVTVSNELTYTNLRPGHVAQIRPRPWQDRTGVAVTGYDAEGSYVGANDWTYYNGQEQIWRVDRLTKPQP